MNFLWITNTIFPAPSKALSLPVPSGGGWMFGLAQEIISSGYLNLTVATAYNGSELRILDIEGVKYCLLPKSNGFYQKKMKPYCQNISKNLNPVFILLHQPT